jgi:uncharacterized protein YdhG (YjbR/CyaY superfamily)
MENKKEIKAAINNYLATLNPVTLEKVSKLRRLLIKALPEAAETFSYGVLAFKDEKTFIYYAGFKSHIGVYPPLTTNAKLVNKINKYKNVKGNLIFKFKDEIPYDLIIEVAKELRKQYAK